MSRLSSLGRSLPKWLSWHQSRWSSTVPPPINEPILGFYPGSPERTKLKEAIAKWKGNPPEIPIVIGGQEYHTGNVKTQVSPYDHSQVVAKYHYATPDLIKKAIATAVEAQKEWEETPFNHRAAIFLRIIDLISTKYRFDTLATTMLGQAKTPFQAEIDSTCETIDFFRFAVKYAEDIYNITPEAQSPNTWNRLEYRPLEGFVASISPFNFTAIGGNLGATPTLMGNVTLWKPSDTALLSNWNLYKIFKEAGVPDGVINFVPADGPTFGDTVTSSPHLAGINFTGSVRTFTHLTKQVGDNISAYNTYPKLVGECGGKNFHFVHKSADIRSVVTGTVRSAFEFGGQKCSACSRLYVPDTLWPKILEEMLAIHKQIKLGSAEDFSSYLSAVIDEKAFDRISTYLEMAENDSNLTVLAGGKADKSVGYFVEPTIVETKDPKHKIMQEEIFGPVLTVYVYPENQWEDCLHTINTTSPYGLTGSIFSQDRSVVRKAMSVLRHAAGNLYINDKSTGSVVGQQPFGGARASGTNDKAGSMFYLLRWVSPITIKETTVPLTEWTYPSVAPDS